MSIITVRHDERTRFTVTVRGHSLDVDQPVDAGGDDAGPTPTELFAASLAACVAHYARSYLVRHGLPTYGLAARARFTSGGRPNRITEIDVELQLPAGIPADRVAPLLAVASHCTVHNTLDEPPTVSVTAAASPSASAA